MQPYFAPALPEAITVPLPETPSGEIDGAAFPVLQKFIKEKRVSLAVIGPGMGPSALVYPFLTQTDLPVLADADALNRLVYKKIKKVVGSGGQQNYIHLGQPNKLHIRVFG